MAEAFNKAHVEAWLGTLGLSAPVRGSDVEELWADLLELQALLEKVFLALARRPEATTEVRPLVDQLLAARQALLLELGERVFAARQAGGKGAVVLTSPPSPPSREASATPWPPNLPATSPLPGILPARSAPPSCVEAALTMHEAMSTDELLTDGVRGMLATFLSLVGPPRELADGASIADETDALEAFADTMERWPLFPKELQSRALEMLVARVRAVKEQGRLPPGIRDQLRPVLAKCPPYAKSNTLGRHIHGLQIAHEPQSASWGADARNLWEALLDAFGPG
jgi:hypothetical protein